MVLSPTLVNHFGDLVLGELHVHAAAMRLGVNVGELAPDDHRFRATNRNIRRHCERTSSRQRRPARLLDDAFERERPVRHPLEQIIARCLV